MTSDEWLRRTLAIMTHGKTNPWKEVTRLEINITPHQPTTAIVRLHGRLNLLVAAEVKQRLLQEVAAGHPILVIDMSNVSFIDSSGLGALIGSLKIARLAGGDLRLAAVPAQTAMLLQLTRLNKILAPYDDVATACQ